MATALIGEMMAFCVDERIENGAIYLGKGALSKLYLKNNACFPWFILVPQIEDVSELYHLKPKDQVLLMEEISALSKLIETVFKPIKINVANLGNVVPQLHIHVVGRYADDPLWPHAIWQETLPKHLYQEQELQVLMQQLKNYLMTEGKTSPLN